MKAEEAEVAIVLMNLGSPDSPKVKDVRTYLQEFLMDERVIDYPYFFRWLLVNGIIAPFRAPKSAEAYRSVWTEKGSPLIVLSEELRDSLKQEVDVPVAIMMRYGNPSPAAVFDRLQLQYTNLKQVLLLPLYPHYAMSSYETAVAYAYKVYNKGIYTFGLQTIKPFYDNPQYITALAESIAPYTAKQYDHILFSYHGVPERHIHKRDVTGSHCLKAENCCINLSDAHSLCYRHQCFATTQLVTEKLNIPLDKYSQSFQSRLGREEWLKPYTAEVFAKLPSQGIKSLLVVCPAFVSDCLETLEEIAEEGKEIFLSAGGENFTLIPCLNTSMLWIKTIAAWLEEYINGDTHLLLNEENVPIR